MAIKLEFQGTIIAKPEGKSIFGESFVEKETYGVITDFNEWAKKRSQVTAELFAQFNSSPVTNAFDRHVAEMILGNFEGYMTHPACLLEGESLVAKTKYVETIDQIMDIKKYLDEEPGKKYLYDVQYWFPRWVIWEINEETFLPTKLEKPKATKSGWKVRYATLGEKND
jgi:hypothetical protein